MPTFSVSGTATRLVREIVEFEVEVHASGLADVEAAVTRAVANGDFEELDCYMDETYTSGPMAITGLTEVHIQPAEETPVETYSPTTRTQDYQPVQARSGAEGVAVAEVQTRPNGYSPSRVRHVPAR